MRINKKGHTLYMHARFGKEYISHNNVNTKNKIINARFWFGISPQNIFLYGFSLVILSIFFLKEEHQNKRFQITIFNLKWLRNSRNIVNRTVCNNETLHNRAYSNIPRRKIHKNMQLWAQDNNCSMKYSLRLEVA